MFAANLLRVLQAQVFARQAAAEFLAAKLLVELASAALTEASLPVFFLPDLQQALQLLAQVIVFGHVRQNVSIHPFETSPAFRRQRQPCISSVLAVFLALNIAVGFKKAEGLGYAPLGLAQIFAQGLRRIRIPVTEGQILHDFKMHKLQAFPAHGLTHQAAVQG